MKPNLSTRRAHTRAHMSFRLSVGDRVRVHQCASDLARTSELLSFPKAMEKYQGLAGTVESVDKSDGTFTIEFDDDKYKTKASRWSWELDWVSILQVKIGPNVFAVDAKVQVLPVISEASKSQGNRLWSATNNIMHGKIGTIQVIEHTGSLTIAFPGAGTIPHWSLEWVRPVDDATSTEKKRKWIDIEADLVLLHASANEIAKKIKL